MINEKLCFDDNDLRNSTSIYWTKNHQIKYIQFLFIIDFSYRDYASRKLYLKADKTQDLIYLNLKINFCIMAAYQDDSTDDEMGVNLQLAQRLSINKNDHGTSSKNPSAGKALKQFNNYQRRNRIQDYQSSSSSSLDTQSDPLVVEGSSGYPHNKKRQNGDKNMEQFSTSKRTCFSNRLLRSPEWNIDDDTPEVMHFSGKIIDSTPKYLFPDKTYEDHLNVISDGEDSDFKSQRHLTDKNISQGTEKNCKSLKNNLPKTSRIKSMYEGQPSGSNGVNIIDSTSDDDSRNIIQNGALKGGKQSSFLFGKKQWNRIVKVLESDSDDDSKVDYRSCPVIFTSSDSDDCIPADKIHKKKLKSVLKKPVNPLSSRSSPKFDSNGVSEGTWPVRLSNYADSPNKHSNSASKKSANILLPSGNSHQSDSNYASEGNWQTRLNDIDSNEQFNTSLPSTSGCRSKNLSSKHKSHNKTSSNRALKTFNSASNNIEPAFPLDDALDRNDSNSHALPYRNLTSLQPRSTRIHRHAGINKHQATHTPNTMVMNPVVVLEPGLFGNNRRSNRLTGTSLPLPVHFSVRDGSSRERSAVQNPLATRSLRRYNTRKSSKGRSINGACSQDTKNNLSIYPDFHAESSDNEFFTANSYSDNESNTESLNGLRMNAIPVSPPSQRQGSHSDNTVNVESSEDEISVIFSSAAHERIPEQRRTRTLGRRYGRSSRGYRLSGQDSVSLSPDPVEQVRQVEDDERYARILQAQFDAETDPTYLPPCVISPGSSFGYVSRDSFSSDDSLDHVAQQRRSNYDTISNLHGYLRLSRHPFSPMFHSSGGNRGVRNRRILDFETRLFNLSSIEDSYEAFLGLDLDVESRGLMKAEINRLPTRKYVNACGASSSTAADVPHKRAELNKECQVCLNDYENGDVLRILPCFHEFHTPCIDPWLKINQTCPVCRVTVNLHE
ncbi:RING finger protein 44 [Caerostris darwini]|uniref:RING finger protein 44 n=1 Tax=Caerostris darwini TaxID=1538125 RepID=A0AAV4U296_9ARAC|nr:RING finger protein 44 [Caerostris darwini]